MPDETSTASEINNPPQPAPMPVDTPVVKAEGEFTLEKIDDDNVRKITSHPDVSIVNIPAMKTAKADLEKTIETLQAQLDQINEVLGEYAKLK
ncbi:MAG: hypothetical protein RLZZ347_320 [Candidatus Parcubacteria bacterium]|jgi:hypothetical protein